MTTLRERAAKLLVIGSGSEIVAAGAIDDVRAMTSRLVEAYKEGPYLSTPAALIEQFKEMDPWIVQDVIDQIGWERLDAFSGDEEAERLRGVRDSRRLNKYDVVTEAGDRTWTNFGFGENIEIRPTDATDPVDNIPRAMKEWKSFWSSPKNRNILGQRHLHKLSDTVLVDGETFFVFFIDKQDKKSPIIRLIDTEEIVEIITDPNDKTMSLWYKREYQDSAVSNEITTIYYPDWLAGVEYDEGGKPQDDDFEPPTTMKDRVTGNEKTLIPDGAKRADTINSETFVCIMHVAHHCKRGLRGWPMGFSGFPWSREHKRFRENRANVSAAMSMFINKIKVKGGSRAVDHVRTNLQSSLVNYATTGATTGPYDRNPPPPAGSNWLENEAVNLGRLSQSTAAGDAKVDGESLLMMAGLAWGLYPHWLGAGDSYRLATATAMESPTMRNFSRYQLFWSSVWKDVVMLILMMDERYGEGDYKTYNADVSTDRLIEVDLKELANAVGSVYRDIINPLLATASTAGINIEGDVVRKTTGHILLKMLQALGVADANDIVEPLLLGKPGQTSAAVVEPEPTVTELLTAAILENVATGAVDAEKALEWGVGVTLDT